MDIKLKPREDGRVRPTREELDKLNEDGSIVFFNYSDHSKGDYEINQKITPEAFERQSKARKSFLPSSMEMGIKR
jgi:hypothetical protein